KKSSTKTDVSFCYSLRRRICANAFPVRRTGREKGALPDLGRKIGENAIGEKDRISIRSERLRQGYCTCCESPSWDRRRHGKKPCAARIRRRRSHRAGRPQESVGRALSRLRSVDHHESRFAGCARR